MPTQLAKDTKKHSTTDTLEGLSDDDYLRSAYSLEISVIMTPLSQFVLYKPGSLNSALDLEIKQWDHDYHTGPYALVGESLQNIRGWASWGLYFDSFREYNYPKIPTLPISAHLNDVMRNLRDTHGVLIRRGDGANPDEILGAIFPLYLNRYQVRSFLYYFILALETRALQYIGLLYPTDEKLVGSRLLSADNIDEAKKELAKRKDRGQKDARLSECLYLWQALKVLNGFERKETINWLVSESFEVSPQDARSFTAQDLKKITIPELTDLRNSIMHPMRPLVTKDHIIANNSGVPAGSVDDLVKKYVLVKKMSQILDHKISLFKH